MLAKIKPTSSFSSSKSGVIIVSVQIILSVLEECFISPFQIDLLSFASLNCISKVLIESLEIKKEYGLSKSSELLYKKILHKFVLT